MPEPRGAQVALPLDLAPQSPYLRLRLCLNEQPKPSFDRGPLGPFSRAPHRFAHQPVVYVNVRPHRLGPSNPYV
jgi:hypothetical protein